MDDGSEGRDIPAVGVLVVVRKSTFRLVLESVARRALRSEEAIVVGCWVAGALEEEEDGEAGSALIVLAVAAAPGVVVDWRWCLEVDEDEGRVIDDALGLLFWALVEGADARFPRCTAAEADFSVFP